MNLFARLFNATKVVINTAIDIVAGPFIRSMKGTSTNTARDTLGGVVRIIYGISFFVTMPAALMAYITWYLTWACRLHIYMAVFKLFEMLFGNNPKPTSFIPA